MKSKVINPFVIRCAKAIAVNVLAGPEEHRFIKTLPLPMNFRVP